MSPPWQRPLPPIKDSNVIRAAQPVEAMLRGPDVDAVQLLEAEEELAAVLEASAREYASLQQRQVQPQQERYPQVAGMGLPTSVEAGVLPLAVGDGVVVVVGTPQRQQPGTLPPPPPVLPPACGGAVAVLCTRARRHCGTGREPSHCLLRDHSLRRRGGSRRGQRPPHRR